MRTNSTKFIGLSATILALLLSGCSFDVSTGSDSDDSGSDSLSLSRSELEEKTEKDLTLDDEDATATVTCDGGLEAEVDATQDCGIKTSVGETGHMRYTVTDVDDDLTFDFVPFVTADEAEELIQGVAEKQGASGEVDCPGEVMGEKDFELECEFTQEVGAEEPKVSPLTIKVSSVEGLRVNLTWSAPDAVVS